MGRDPKFILPILAFKHPHQTSYNRSCTMCNLAQGADDAHFKPSRAGKGEKQSEIRMTNKANIFCSPTATFFVPLVLIYRVVVQMARGYPAMAPLAQTLRPRAPSLFWRKRKRLDEVTNMRNLRYLPFFLFAFIFLAIASATSAQVDVGLSIRVGPPPIPVYTQPMCPGDGFMWTPGYWAYATDDYYWVPGTWVHPPRVGLLWTPGWWGWEGGFYRWRMGYWGPHVGFYGGINYGFGYGGVGFFGGFWRGGFFQYNRAVTRVNVNVVHNTYNKTVVNNNSSHTSFNGGTGGTTNKPTGEERNAEHENHTGPTSEQTNHEHSASQNRSQFNGVNHGNPTTTGSSRPGQFRNADGTRTNGNANGTKNGSNGGTHNGANGGSRGGGNGGTRGGKTGGTAGTGKSGTKGGASRGKRGGTGGARGGTGGARGGSGGGAGHAGAGGGKHGGR